jgi:hypothetical protein
LHSQTRDGKRRSSRGPAGRVLRQIPLSQVAAPDSFRALDNRDRSAMTARRTAPSTALGPEPLSRWTQHREDDRRRLCCPHRAQTRVASQRPSGGSDRLPNVGGASRTGFFDRRQPHHYAYGGQSPRVSRDEEDLRPAASQLLHQRTWRYEAGATDHRIQFPTSAPPADSSVKIPSGWFQQGDPSTDYARESWNHAC